MVNVGYVHMNGAGDERGAVFPVPEHFFQSLLDFQSEPIGNFGADPLHYAVGIIPTDDWEKVEEVVESPNHGGYEPFKKLTLDEINAMAEKYYEKNPERLKGTYYFRGKVLTAAEIMHELIEEFDPDKDFQTYPISLASMGELKPKFWNKEWSVSIFQKNPHLYPGWEKLVENDAGSKN